VQILFVIGPSVLKASYYSLAVDRLYVVSNISSFMKAWTLLFATYFVFNVEYAASAVCTLEFFQR